MKMDSSNKKILIMAGGTGGHVFPALSIAEYLLSRGIQVEWLGTRKGLEATVISETDIPLHFISIAGLRGSSVLKKILSPFVIVVAVLQAMRKVIQIKPGCVLGMGGFVTGPGGMAAFLLRKKLLIHEQNAIAGLTNQLLFPFAATVMEAFPGAFERKKAITKNSMLKSFIKAGKTTVVGNPVRKDILALAANKYVIANTVTPDTEYSVKPEQQKLRVLIIGGSLGAVAINKAIPAMLALMPAESRPDVIHQCGNRNVEETTELYREQNIELNQNIQLKPFIENMAEGYAWADIIIARAGAMTVAEIAAVGLASILIPYPYAVDDHQTENAAYLVRAGAADLIPQNALTPQALLSIVKKYSENKNALQRASMNARNASVPDATEKAAGLCMEACYV